MSLRRLSMYFSALVGGACTILLILYVWLPAPAEVTKRNFNRIEIGMTYESVVDIFCAKERFIDGNSVFDGDNGEAWIQFDDQGQVTRKEWFPGRGR